MVLATFGTTHDQEDDFVEHIRNELAERHPEMDVFIAFTSRIVSAQRRKKGEAANALAQVLSELSGLGYTHVAVQSLHVAPGMEFAMLSDIAKRFADMPKGIRRTVVGHPLVYNDKNAERLAAVLSAELPESRAPEDAVVFVGHGAKLPSGTLTYPALQAYFWQRDANIFVGTVEGSLGAETIRDMLLARGIRKVWLAPLLAYYGAHARCDIFGEKDSWVSVLESAGIHCTPVEKALLARPSVTAMWVENAVKALEELEE